MILAAIVFAYMAGIVGVLFAPGPNWLKFVALIIVSSVEVKRGKE